MLDKDIKDLLEEIKGLADILVSDDKLDKVKKMSGMLDKAIKEDTTISIQKHGNGKSDVKIEGSRLGLLVTLAGLEQSVLQQLHCDQKEFDFIKTITGVKEAD